MTKFVTHSLIITWVFIKDNMNVGRLWILLREKMNG